MPVTLQSLDIAVLVIPRNVLREAVRIRADTCCLAIGSVQHPVKTVISEFVTTDCTFVPGLPGHAADAAVVLRSTHTRVVVQVLREACAADSRQPATQVVGISQLVGARTVILLGQQTTEVVISRIVQSNRSAAKTMPHFAYSVRMVVGIGIYFRARGLSAGSMCMCHTRRLVGESINRTCDVVATEQVVLHKHGRTGRRIPPCRVSRPRLSYK